jgi:two-component system chemotaxis sensor kinase CheA
MHASGERNDEASATILICGDSHSKSQQRMGVVVRRVLDVSDGTLLEKDAAAGDAELALVKDRLTTVFRGFAAETGPGWKEVA